MGQTRNPTAPELDLQQPAAAASAGAPEGAAHSGTVDRPADAAHDSSDSSSAAGTQMGKRHRFGLSVSHPVQVRCSRGMSALAWVGRVGWCGKAVVYASIGGLACRTAVNPFDQSNQGASISPQGAFTMLGTTGSHGVNVILLIIMAACLAAYITWRFAEAATGQGYDATFSSKKNFFKYRVSPAVSGAVYVTYLTFICKMVSLEVDPDTRVLPEGQQAALAGDNAAAWPSSWRFSKAGRAGLAVIGVAFLIATCIQLQGVLTRAWHLDYRQDLPRRLSWAVLGIGHIGFLGRGAAFLAMAVLFFKDAGGVDAPHESSMVANALQQLNVKGLRGLLFIVGFLLIVYGLFATLSAVFRVFPTPAPSRMIPVPVSQMSEEHKAQIAALKEQIKEQKRQQGGCCSMVCKRLVGIQHRVLACCCGGQVNRQGQAKEQLPVTAVGLGSSGPAALVPGGKLAPTTTAAAAAPGDKPCIGGSILPLHVVVSGHSKRGTGPRLEEPATTAVHLQPRHLLPSPAVEMRAGSVPGACGAGAGVPCADRAAGSGAGSGVGVGAGARHPPAHGGSSVAPLAPQQLGWPFTRSGPQQQQQQHGHREEQQGREQPGRQVAGGQERPSTGDSGAAEGRYLVQQVEENRIVDVV